MRTIGEKELKIIRVRFVYRVLQKVTLRGDPLPLIRGVFGKKLRRIACVTKKPDCNDCTLTDICPYTNLFKTGYLTSHRATKPVPFVPYFPYNTGEIEEKEPLSIEFVLVGVGIGYLPFMVQAMRSFRRFAGGEIEYQGMDFFDVTSDRWVGPASVAEAIKSAFGLSRLHRDDVPDEVVLDFVTPTRIMTRNGLVTEPDFQTIIRRIVRRINMFAEHERLEPIIFESIADGLDGVKVVESHLSWVRRRRRTSQGGSQDMSGFVGTVRFRGELRKWWGMLKFGEFLNIGKGTSFGSGKYIMTVPMSSMVRDVDIIGDGRQN